MSHAFQCLTLRIVCFAPPDQNVDSTLYSGKRVLDLVSHSSRKLADNRELRGALQLVGLVANLLLGQFQVGYVVTDSNVLVRLAVRVEEGNYRRVNPINAAILR